MFFLATGLPLLSSICYLICFVYNVVDIYRHGILDAGSLWQPLWDMVYGLNTICLSALIVVCIVSTLHTPVKTMALFSCTLAFSLLVCLAHGIMYLTKPIKYR